MNAWKHFLLWIGFLGITTSLFAQFPQGINYQGIARVNGTIWTNQSFLVRFTVFSDPGGTNLVYMESHNVSSNQYGLFTAVIGNGIPSTGIFTSIDWGVNDHALQVEIDDGSGYVILGLKQLQAVPYAFNANKASQMVMSDLIDVDTTGLNPGQVLKWNGTTWIPQNDSVNTQLLSVTGNLLSISTGNSVTLPGANYTAGTGLNISGNIITNTGDLSPLNELQTISISGNNLTLSHGGGSVTLPTGSIYTSGPGISISGTVITNTGDLNSADDITIGSIAGGDLGGTYPNPSVARIRGNTVANVIPLSGQVLKYSGTQWEPLPDLIDDADNNPSNELQVLSLSGSSLSLSNGGGSVNLPVYTGGTGIDVIGSVIINTGDTNAADDITASTSAGGDLSGTYPNPTVASLQGIPLVTGAPTVGQIIKYNGTAWVSATDNGTTYTGSTGISISGTVITNTGDTDPTDDITTSTSAGGDLGGIYPNPTVNAIAGNPVSSFPPSPNQVLKWDGSQWYPGLDSSQNIWDVVGSNISYTNGNVGIGVFNPAVRLEVNGAENIVNSSGEKRVEMNVVNDEGFIGVYDSNNVLKAGIQIDGTGQGEIFGDVKNFRVPHPNDANKEIWYASLEGPEAAAYARGTATLVDGEISVSFPEHYQLVSSGEGMTILLTPLSADSEGLAVIEKGLKGFTVKELRKGKGNYSFDWEVKCIRKGHEDYKIIRPKK